MFTEGFCDRLLAMLQQTYPIVKDKQFNAKDIHHISLSASQFDSVPGEHRFDAFIDCDIKEFDGLEFRRSKWSIREYTSIDELRDAIAFNLTGTTTRMFDFGKVKVC